VLAQGRTLTHFHAFYDHGRALPTLARLDAEPCVWLSPADAAARGVTHGAPILLSNARGHFAVRAHVTDRVPAGTAWIRDGWEGLNRLTSGRPSIPDAAVDTFSFAAGQAEFETFVEVTPR
jgi:anaerobic selenocysteine-containing dehydrogenase